MKVFVTGGSGFIGGKLIEALRADGDEVRGLARSDAAAEAVGARGAEPVHGDLGDRAALQAAAAGCELAFHCAAKVEDSGPWPEFERVNVGGTANVSAACAAAGVRRLVHVSTEAVLIAGEPLVQVDETAPRRPDSPAPYPRSKALAEEAVLAASGIERVIARLDLAKLSLEVIERIDLPEIIRTSTGTVASESVRVVRMQTFGADRAISGLVNRMLGRSTTGGSADRGDLDATGD